MCIVNLLFPSPDIEIVDSGSTADKAGFGYDSPVLTVSERD
jgi:hypothetical protein